MKAKDALIGSSIVIGLFTVVFTATWAAWAYLPAWAAIAVSVLMFWVLLFFHAWLSE